MDEGCLSFPGTSLSRGLAKMLQKPDTDGSNLSKAASPVWEGHDDEDAMSSSHSLEEGPVERSVSVQVKYQDLAGRLRQVRLEGFTARLFQHEFDHLKGVLLVDKVGEQLRSMS
jgi:peptide deformylase